MSSRETQPQNRAGEPAGQGGGAAEPSRGQAGLSAVESP